MRSAELGVDVIGYGSFLNVAVAMSSRLPLDSFDRLSPSGPRKTGHSYMTRMTTISPGFPGLYCQVLVTCPLPSWFKLGIAVLAVANEAAVCTSIMSPLQLNSAWTFPQTAAAKAV